MASAELFRMLKASGIGLIADLGRPGQQIYGIPLGGSLDPLSLRMMNHVLGNRPEAACLELSGQFRFECLNDCFVMVGPEGCRAKLDGLAIESGRKTLMRRGQIMETLKPEQGLWTQIAVSGGIEGPLWRYSRSTALFLGNEHEAGGLIRAGQVIHRGRKLKDFAHLAGLTDPANEPDPACELTDFANEPDPACELTDSKNAPNDKPLRIRLPSFEVLRDRVVRVGAVKGPEWGHSALLTAEAEAKSLRVKVGREGSRMGLRLTHKDLDAPVLKPAGSYTSYPGMIQWPGSETLLLLLSDAQATGGYSRYGSVVSSDLWKLAYLEPGGVLEIHWVSLCEAKRQRDSSVRHLKTFLAQGL